MVFLVHKQTIHAAVCRLHQFIPWDVSPSQMSSVHFLCLSLPSSSVFSKKNSNKKEVPPSRKFNKLNTLEMCLFQPIRDITSSGNDIPEEMSDERAFVFYLQSILSKQGRLTTEVQVLKRLTVFWEETSYWK